MGVEQASATRDKKQTSRDQTRTRKDRDHQVRRENLEIIKWDEKKSLASCRNTRNLRLN